MGEESSISRNAFELIFAMDEVISAGQKEKVTVSRIKTLTEMDSHEEKIHDIVERGKQRGAQETANIKRKEIAMQRKGMGGGGMGGSMSMGGQFASEPVAIKTETPKPQPARTSGKKGMQLKPKSKQSDQYLKALQDIGEIGEDASYAMEEAVDAVAMPTVDKKGIHVEIEETLNVVLTQDGALESMELKGELRIEIINPEQAHVLVNLAKSKKDLVFRTHPNINKPRFNKESTIALKDTSKAFPIRTPLGVLKWRFTSSDESDIPLNVTCWPTPGSDMVTVNLEYELMQTDLQLQDVEIYVPIPQGHQPVVEQADGAYDFDSTRGHLIWRLAVVDADNAGGSLEFTLPFAGSSEVFFPVGVRFRSLTPYSGLSIKEIKSVEDGSTLDYSSLVHFAAGHGDYQVQFQ